MKNRALFHFGVTALVLSGAVAGTAAFDGMAIAGARDDAKASKQASDLSRKAMQALAKRQPEKAVQFAESAVSLQPQDANYRALLGQSYLAAGRFTSAQTALSDALTLDPTLGKAALSLALAQIGTGDWATARKTLDANVATIPASDRGLAVALAGDPATAVQILMAAARGPDSDAKVRQNLALAMALAGNWQEAKVIASADLAPTELDARMLQWATFAHPSSASDQVAALLGVNPVADGGQPVALALNADRNPVALAAQSTVPVDAYMPGQQTGETAVVKDMQVPAPAAAMAVPAPAPYVDDAAAPRPQMASITFAAAREIVQALPKSYSLVKSSEARVAAVDAVRPTARGKYFVQLGAYRSAGAARVAWAGIARQHPSLAGHSPSGANINARGVSFYRLSVGAFARADADALCNGIKSSGSRCFVRASAGDRVASWASAAQVAMR